MLECDTDNLDVVFTDLKRRLRLRFERMKSLSAFNWKSNSDLFATFKCHHEYSKEIMNKFDHYDMSAENQLYIAIINFVSAVADIMFSQPYWKGQSRDPIDKGVWRHGYKELVLIHRFVRLPIKQKNS